MREIKFRAWDNNIKVMQYAKNTTWFEFAEYCKPCIVNSGTTGYERVSNDKIELMQYTGLKDMNGVEIYEGDIVRFAHEDYFNHEDNSFYEDCEENGIGQVYWGGSYPAFDIGELHNKNIPAHECDYNIFSDESHYFEVVGNIYENPELLKETK